MKALLIAPVFFGYEKSIKRALEKINYQVDYLDSEQLKPEYWRCWNKDFWHKARRHILPGQRERDRKKADVIFVKQYLDHYLDQIDINENAYSLILTVKGDFIQDAFYDVLKEKNPKARFILYLWDDVDPLHRKDFFSYFDDVFSYNIMDCEKYAWKYLPIFIQRNPEVSVKDKRAYDIAVIGTAHKERVRIVKRIYRKYKNKYRFFIYLLNKNGVKNDFYAKDKELSYEEYMEILSDSKAVLDNPANKQKGPTTRVFDAYQTDTKVITTNKYISKFPIYSENIQIIDKWNIDISKEFIDSPYKREIQYVPSIDEWIEVLLANE